MLHGFDDIIDRRGTNCVKWEFILEENTLIYSDHADPRHGPDRVLPMWVSDMDFRSPPAVIEALTNRARHGVYGYSYPSDSYYEAVLGWMARRHGWSIERVWIEHTPGVVPAVNMLVQSFVGPGEKVLLQPPVYYPFFDAIEQNGAVVAANSLLYKNGRYHMDFADLDQKAADPAVKMAILCSPHNPIGRVWTRDELIRFGEICLENDVLVVSDEIYADLVYKDYTFTPYGTLDEALVQNSVICTAASKSFNLAGLTTSNIIIANEVLRERFSATVQRNGLLTLNAFGLVATEAAYNHGQAWLAAVMACVEANLNYMTTYIGEHLPMIRVVRPEGTYLVWVDFRGLGLDEAARKSLLMERARVHLDEGGLFGAGGEGFERFNIACPRSILEEALDRIKTAVDEIVIAN